MGKFEAERRSLTRRLPSSEGREGNDQGPGIFLTTKDTNTRMEGTGVLPEGTEIAEDWFGLTHLAVCQPVCLTRSTAKSLRQLWRSISACSRSPLRRTRASGRQARLCAHEGSLG